jgi:hypothetical protein
MSKKMFVSIAALVCIAGGIHASAPVAAAEHSDQTRERKFENPSFAGTRIVNLPTAQTLNKGEFLFRISHRFLPPISSGRESFAGLDGPAYILLSLGYGITDNMMMTIGRTNNYQEWELYADWRVLDQARTGAVPLSCALHVGGNVVTQEQPEGTDWSGRFRFSALVTISHQINERVSLALVPAYSSNTNFWDPASDGTFALGLGGRILTFDDVSLIGEWIPVLAGYEDFADGWGLGVEKKLGGHLFQLFVTDAYGLPASQYLVGGDLGEIDSGFWDKLRFGFNIFRTI